MLVKVTCGCGWSHSARSEDADREAMLAAARGLAMGHVSTLEQRHPSEDDHRPFVEITESVAFEDLADL